MTTLVQRGSDCVLKPSWPEGDINSKCRRYVIMSGDERGYLIHQRIGVFVYNEVLKLWTLMLEQGICVTNGYNNKMWEYLHETLIS